ncbi:anthranilate phosphoribosyltransferase [Altibacter sp.]|uniref:anthranilate phosphoribosyltransferase n=1 Tax=Altibacter sp. TaxID=2024823 RepID=UPI00258CC0F2|nr:anthranilate phosphoribosyltransferase [Altibacter sp.]MCW8980774.1 anthranilate phosphoribosyltransferase [Altibacter sp.]MCW9038222.1 anthranilate phosphoribosyltransferase [Altibacter sp.]
MKALLNRLISHEQLSKDEARDVLVAISEGKFNQSQIAAFLTVYMMRSVTLDELSGFREALLDLCIKVAMDDYNTIDLCGTGGDGKNTFNISTLASFVTAGAGVLVTKHGNYGVSSISGSSNVMEALGITFSNDEEHLKKCLEKAGICILHAPLFHPAMKHVAPIRKELAVKTFFNMLGPMVNPAQPNNQLVGVYDLELARLYGYIYQKSTTNYTIVHAMDGYDEISLTGPAKVITRSTETILHASDFNVTSLAAPDIYGGSSVKESANLFMNILKGKGTDAQQNVVCANAALAIAEMKQCTLNEGFEKAKYSLESGKALLCLQQLQQMDKGL